MAEKQTLVALAHDAMDTTVGADEAKRRLAPHIVTYLQRLRLDALTVLANGNADARFSAGQHILLDATRDGVITTVSQIDDAVRVVSAAIIVEA